MLFSFSPRQPWLLEFLPFNFVVSWFPTHPTPNAFLLTPQHRAFLLFFLFTLQSLFLLLSSTLLNKFLCSFLSFFYEKSLEKVDQNIFVFHEILRFALCCCGDEHEGGHDDEASHGLFSGSGSSNSSNVGTRYVWSWDRVFGRLSIPVPSRPGIAIYTYNIII